MTVTCKAKYDKLNDKTDVTVVYEANQKDQSISFSWEINYPMSQLIERAALNTVMGLGIVFLTLLFLSWLIGKLHIIPDMIEKKAKKNEPVAPAAPVTFAGVRRWRKRRKTHRRSRAGSGYHRGNCSI